MAGNAPGGMLGAQVARISRREDKVAFGAAVGHARGCLRILSCFLGPGAA